ncbi:MAG: hypothetical protein ABI262_06070 [Microcoleus sp.]
MSLSKIPDYLGYFTLNSDRQRSSQHSIVFHLLIQLEQQEPHTLTDQRLA